MGWGDGLGSKAKKKPRNTEPWSDEVEITTWLLTLSECHVNGIMHHYHLTNSQFPDFNNFSVPESVVKSEKLTWQKCSINVIQILGEHRFQVYLIFQSLAPEPVANMTMLIAIPTFTQTKSYKIDSMYNYSNVNSIFFAIPFWNKSLRHFL